MKLYVGNLNFRITEDDLRALFEAYGPIDDLIILNDRETGRSRGFGFITLGDDDKAKLALEELNQKEFEGRNLVLNEARPRTERPASSDGGNSDGNSGDGGGYANHRDAGGGYRGRDDL